MTEKMSRIGEWFWNDDLWLPPNVTWRDFESNEQFTYYNFYELWYPIPAAVLLIFVRHFFESTVFRPFGICLGLRPKKHRKAPFNEVLEQHFQSKSSSVSHEVAEDLGRQVGMSTRQVERWFRVRLAQDRPTTLEKFSETGWRWLYYTFAFVFGMAVLWSKPWLWDIKECWFRYPHHHVDSGIWWYYMFEMAFYWSLCISQFNDVKRKDFWEMMIHHVTTLALMAFSWTCNLTRVGSLVLATHDVADVFLEAAKMFKYADKQIVCDVLFVTFTLTWIVTRLGVFPIWIVYSTTIEAPQILEMFPAYYLFNGLLSILLMLHVIWTYFILKIVYRGLFSGKTTKDSRSDSSAVTLSSSENGELDENTKKQS